MLSKKLFVNSVENENNNKNFEENNLQNNNTENKNKVDEKESEQNISEQTIFFAKRMMVDNTR